MCVNDWRLGRLIRSVTTSGLQGAISGSAVPANKNRVGILFAYASATASVNNGFNILLEGSIFAMVGMGQPTLHLTLTGHGDLVQHAFSMTTIGASTGTWSVTEFILPEEYLAAGVEEFRRNYMRR